MQGNLNRRWLYLVVFACAAIASCTTTPTAVTTAVTEVPYRIDFDGWYTIDVTVNGARQYPFIVDTGATITSAFNNLGRTNLMPILEGPKVRVLGLSGGEDLERVQIGDLQFGNIEMKKHIGVVLNDWRNGRRTPSGVLGLDILTNYIVEFDNAASLIRFYDLDTDIADITRGFRRADLKPIAARGATGQLYTIDVEMNGEPVTCIIDLGANGTVINTAAINQFIDNGFFDIDQRLSDSKRNILRDIFDNAEAAPPIQLQHIKFAGRTWRNVVAVVHDSVLFTELGVSGGPFCLFGADLLAGRRFIFDFSNEKFYMQR